MKWPFVSLEKYESVVNKHNCLFERFSETVTDYKHIIENLKNKDRYYVCIDEEGLESEDIYANNVYVEGDYFLFCTERKTVAIMSREIWQDVVCREKSTEEN